jgi:prephenate dehydrogenase
VTRRRVTIIGLGLMGGSLARALAARDFHVFGYDRQIGFLNAAVDEGIVHEPLGHRLVGAEQADVVVLATPVAATRSLLAQLGPRLTAGPRLVMDLSSTKRSVVVAAEAAGLGPRFVGAHPLTGSHRSGWGASRASLFDEARVFLCPTPSTAPETMLLAESFWRALRSGVEQMDAAEHDVQMAWLSHLPHVVASALALTLADAGVRRSSLGPGGRDVTRVAGGEPSMWTGIAADNAASIDDALGQMVAQLQLFRERLARGDTEGMHELFSAGRDWFDGEPLPVLTPGAARA